MQSHIVHTVVFFVEGFAEMMAERFYHGEPWLDNGLRIYNDSLISIPFLVQNDTDIGEDSSSFAYWIVYLEGGSFLKFPDKKYGRESIQALHQSIGTDYHKVFGKSLATLEAEWLEYLFSSTDQDTVILKRDEF